MITVVHGHMVDVRLFFELWSIINGDACCRHLLVNTRCLVQFVKVLVWFGLVWFGLVWFGLVWFGLVWFGLVWFGLIWLGLVWFGLIWLGLFVFFLLCCTKRRSRYIITAVFCLKGVQFNQSSGLVKKQFNQ